MGGSIHINDSLAILAHGAAESACFTLAGLDSDFLFTNPEIGGLILLPGVYTLTSEAQITGTLTLDGNGFLNPVWIFQIGSTLKTASGANVLAVNGANASNVFFQVGSSATLGAGTGFVGNILADQSISTTSGVNVFGRLLAVNAAVTMDGTVVAIPEASSSLMVILSLVGLASYRRRA